MKLKNCIVFTVFAVLLGAWIALAYEQPPPEAPPVGGGSLDMMQLALDLTDEQNRAVQEILTGNQHGMADIFEHSGLNHGDMSLLHGITEKFRQLSLESLAAVFNKDQLLILKEKVFNSPPFEFIVMSGKEKLALVQDSLKMSGDQVSQVAGIMAEESAKHEVVLNNLGFNIEQITAIQEATAVQHKEMMKRLSTVLSKEQLEKFEILHMKMAQKGHVHGHLPMNRGERR
ncbi:MAG: hypothetical protein KKD01_02450 [Proteobacteria bacterium]|nr:hypothetical protein [Pseudomonadota bacterium]MBU1416853.1 hypothetical protein [Pseudomonadota bacterium]MBU1453562.1 hypothetical protein [Pseudomonadota bacterium]